MSFFISYIRPLTGKAIYLGFLFLLGCVEPFDIGGNPNPGAQLAVEGFVNDVDEVFTVRLRTVSTFDGVEVNALGSNAQIQIVSGSEEIIHLQEVSSGVYRSDSAALTGMVGESYTLRIQLANGESYVSSTETIPEPVNIGESRVDLVENRGEDDDRVPFVQYSHNIFTTLENTAEDHFVRVVTSGWARVQVGYPLCGGFGGGDSGPAGLPVCWARRNPITREITTITNQGLARESKYEVLAGNLIADTRDKLVAEVSANAMSSTAFNFWEIAKVQTQSTGGIFDPPFAPIVGNIRNVNDPDEVVLGYFHAYAKTTTRVCVDRQFIPIDVEIPIIDCNNTCIRFYSPATFELPFDESEVCP